MKEENEEKTRDEKKEAETHSNIIYVLVILAVALVLFNQYQIFTITGAITGTTTSVVSTNKDVSGIDVSEIKSTAHAIAALFPVDNVKTAQDAIDIIIPTGTPEYGNELGVSYDDPVSGLSTLVQVYRTIKLTEEENQRYVGLVTQPVGISCEYCCGVSNIGADENGNSICGCQHNPALLGLTKWLIQNTDYTDQEIIREAIKWKALFFPKNMVELTTQVAGKDISSLELPGMVGGC